MSTPWDDDGVVPIGTGPERPGILERLRRRFRHAVNDDPLPGGRHLTPEGYTVITLEVALHTLQVLTFALDRSARTGTGVVPAGTALPLSAARSVLDAARQQGIEW